MRESLRGVPYCGSMRSPGVVLKQASCSAKLSPVRLVPGPGKPKPIPQGPLCSSTYISIRNTCPKSCAFLDNGCYAQNGTSRRIMSRLDSEEDAANAHEYEASLLSRAFGGGPVPQDGARGGRDLRLHVGGDVRNETHAMDLAHAAHRWWRRGGGTVWTYTHRWRDIPAIAWGTIRVWASCETTGDVRLAHSRGYRAALVVHHEWHGKGAYSVDGVKVVPCPFETIGKTCVECRLCLDDRASMPGGQVIGFSAHGGGKEKARQAIKLRVIA